MKKKAILLLAVVTALILPVTTADAASYFSIRDYDIRMVINEDDTYDITEELDVEFTVPSHGIYRSIPARTDLDRDGQQAHYYAKVRNFKVMSGQPFEEERSKTDYIYKIGDPGRFTPAETHYSYSYTYDPLGDHFKGGDEVYHNLVGTSWEAMSIDHVSFEIVFPKDIDMDKVGIKTGDNSYVHFEAADPRTVKGETTEDVRGGLTLRAVLPEGYFTREAKDPVGVFYAVTALLALLAAAGFVMWRKYGRDPVYPETLEFYPPDGITAPEAAYLSKESVSKAEVVSIMLTLADKGYLKIHEFEEEESEEKKRRKKKEKTVYEIEKIRDYDEDVIGEKEFMEGLFSDGDKVRAEDLENEFYKTAESITEEIKKKYEGKLYDEKAGNKALIMYTAGALGIYVLAAAAKLTGGTGFSESLLRQLLLLVPHCIIILFGFAGFSEALKENHKSLISPVMSAIFTGAGIYLQYRSRTFYGWQIIPYAIGLSMCLLLFIMGALCEKKTDYYASLLARLNGYTDFLKTAEKDKMEEIAEEDPGYFYRNLAFAFALGVTAVYAERFASIAKEKPDWYTSDIGGFNTLGTAHMLDSINSMTESVSSSMSSSPSDGSGGGSFSGGGGGGGGGGGSW